MCRKGLYESCESVQMYYAVIGCGVDAGVAAEWGVGYVT